MTTRDRYRAGASLSPIAAHSISRPVVRCLLAVFALVFSTQALYAATLAAGRAEVAAPAVDVLVPITLESGAREEVAAIQFDFRYDAGVLTAMSFAAGPAAQDAGKSVSSFVLEEGAHRVIVVGLNKEPIANGVVVNVFFEVPEDATPGEYVLAFENEVLSNPVGVLVPSQTRPGKIIVERPTPEGSNDGEGTPGGEEPEAEEPEAEEPEAEEPEGNPQEGAQEAEQDGEAEGGQEGSGDGEPDGEDEGEPDGEGEGEGNNGCNGGSGGCFGGTTRGGGHGSGDALLCAILAFTLAAVPAYLRRRVSATS